MSPVGILRGGGTVGGGCLWDERVGGGSGLTPRPGKVETSVTPRPGKVETEDWMKLSRPELNRWSAVEGDGGGGSTYNTPFIY